MVSSEFLPDGSTQFPVIAEEFVDVKEMYHINRKIIGTGHYGVVRECIDRQSGERFAIKSIRKAKVGNFEMLKREIIIHAEVNHPNIVGLVDFFEDPKYVHLVTELCTGGELFDKIVSKAQDGAGCFSESETAHLILSILDAVAYLHSKDIAHRDLKPENFLFSSKDDDARMKIIDFGLSRNERESTDGIMRTKVGTPYYVAPEVLNREYTKSCDVWSLGVITYIMICGYPPFYGDDKHEIFSSVRGAKFDFPSPDWDNVSDEAKAFITSLLSKDPASRPSATEAMQHPWILSHCSEQTEDQREDVDRLGPLTKWTSASSSKRQRSVGRNDPTTTTKGALHSLRAASGFIRRARSADVSSGRRVHPTTD